MPVPGARVTWSTLSSVYLMTTWLQLSMKCDCAQRSLISLTFRSNGAPENSSRWNRNSGASAYANAAWLVIGLAPQMRGFSSPR